MKTGNIRPAYHSRPEICLFQYSIPNSGLQWMHRERSTRAGQPRSAIPCFTFSTSSGLQLAAPFFGLHSFPWIFYTYFFSYVFELRQPLAARIWILKVKTNKKASHGSLKFYACCGAGTCYLLKVVPFSPV